LKCVSISSQLVACIAFSVVSGTCCNY
jgi:hypothetical protein